MALNFGRTALAIGTLVMAATANATLIDFNAVSLRGSNADGTLPTITEYANGNGVSVGNLVAGQKAYYGTSHFGGQTVSSVDTIKFTYRPAGGALPYVNLNITNGATTGVLALTSAFSNTSNGDGSFTVIYDLSTAGLGFYERVGADPAFAPLNYGAIDDWTFLTTDRPLSPGEDALHGHPRGPVSDSLAILWGDSSNNYLGAKDIYDVSVTSASGEIFQAGNAVPEPGSLALIAIGLLGAAAVRRRKAA